jgi:hypothetical protein
MGALEAMTTPQAQVAKAFGEKKTLYEILGVAKDAASAVIRKAYFKMALTCVSKGATLANPKKMAFSYIRTPTESEAESVPNFAEA